VQPFLTWKAISTTYSECVYVALAIQHAIRTRRIVTCGLILVFSRHIFRKNSQISNFIKIHPVGAELVHANRHTDRRKDGQTEDMKKLIVALRNFPKSA
jgi:hypothetical protein